MKRVLFPLLLCIIAVMNLSAQNKSTILNEINNTIQDFAADLSSIGEDESEAEFIIGNISKSFGSSEYFFFNGKEMGSLSNWLKLYNEQALKGESVTHTFTIKQQTLQKVDPDEDNDKRYRFDAVMTRETGQGQSTPTIVSFVVLHNGEGRYTTILECRGDWGLDVLEIRKIDNKYIGFKIPDWLLFGSMALFLIGMLTLWIAPKIKKDLEESNVFLGFMVIITLFPAGILGFIDFVCCTSDEARQNFKSYDVVSFVDSLDVAWVRQGDKIGLMDYNSNLILDYQFDTAGSFMDGLSCVRLGSRYAFVDGDGDVFLPPVYTYAKDFHDGLTIVGNEQGYSLINKKGHVVSNLSADEIRPFSEGMAAYRYNGKYGYLGEYGHIPTMPCQFSSAEPFKNGIAVVSKGHLFGCIDKNGKEVIPFRYDAIERTEHGFVVKRKGKFGVLDEKGKVLVPIQWDRIQIIDRSKARVYIGKESDIIQY